jgi:hypothetical protein
MLPCPYTKFLPPCALVLALALLSLGACGLRIYRQTDIDTYGIDQYNSGRAACAGEQEKRRALNEGK